MIKFFGSSAFVFVLVTGIQISVYADRGRVDEILVAAARAVGPAKEISKIRSITSTAACVGPKGAYSTTVVSFREDLTLFEQTYSYKDPLSVSINRDTVWGQKPETGKVVLLDAFQRMVARLHEYQKMAFEPRKFFKELEYVGEDEFAGRPAHKIGAKTELDIPAFLYFDTLTKRLAGYRLLIPNSTDTVTNILSGWNKVGSLTLPSLVTAIDNAGEWTLRFHSIRLNSADRRLLDVPPRVADQAELLRLHEQQKTAHLTHNSDLFVEMFAENLTQLQRGEISIRTKDENRMRFKSYFATFKFKEWENIRPPVISVSKDGSMATIAVQKRVRGTYKNEKGDVVEENVVYAWLEVWEKINRKWKVVTVASTERDGSR
ncbi:MAG: hypothetical protein KBF83_03480 [Pyrinomonadaceae bacterium]|nr:hypothetical protein [Pyrinomonadaceae bacterium]MBP9108597.1 hypothetical protein [Pyrinomonadaceae bacterium]